jgi:hypothetical protein
MSEDTTGSHETTSANPSSGNPSRQRVDVCEAARILGLSVEAIRKRVQSGTIEHEKEPAGRVWILLDSDWTAQEEVQATTGRERRDHVQDQDRLLEAKDETIEDLRDRVRYLEEANRENRRLLAAALERIPALEGQGQPERPGAPESDEGEHFSTSTQEAEESLHTHEQRSRLYRFFFGP